MRRCLDSELENRKITKRRMHEILRRIHNEYGIDIRKLLSNADSIYDNISSEVAQKSLEPIDGQNISLEKASYQWMDYVKMGFPISPQQLTRKEEKHNDDKSSIVIGKRFDTLLQMYNAIMEPGEIQEYIVEISQDEWKQQMNYMVRLGKIFELDFEIQYFLQLKYTLMCGKTYNLFENKNKEKLEPYDRLSKDEYFPMADPQKLPIFIKELQNILFTQKYIRIFDFETFGKDDNIKNGKMESNDITRYSFAYVKQIYNELVDSELENLYYLDNMLGVSLTNTIFYYTINRSWSKYDMSELDKVTIDPDIFDGKLFDIITILGKLEFMYGRNYIAQMTFNFLWQHKFDNKKVDKVYQYLKENINRYNKYYWDLNDIHTWRIFNNIEEWPEEEKNQFIEELSYEWKDAIKSYIYEQEIKEIDKIIKKEKNKDKEEKEKDKEEKEKDKDKEEKDKNSKGDRIRRSKIIKKPEVLYAQIHEAVMKGIWKK